MPDDDGGKGGSGGDGGQGAGAGGGGGNGGGAGAAGGQSGAGGARGGGGDKAPEGIEQAEWDALSEPGKRALERVRAEARDTKAQLAEAAAKAAKFDELEEAKKDELTKAQEALSKAEEAAATAAHKNLQLTVALDAGLQHTMAPRLQGATKAELEEDAKALAQQLNVGPGRRTAGNAGDGGGEAAGEGGMDGWIRGRAGRS